MGNTANLELWASRERACFIERCAFWRGVVNRGNVMDVFGVSAAQCSADFTKYQQTNPAALIYQMRRKRYEGAVGMKCVLHEPRLEEAMAMFLRPGGLAAPRFNLGADFRLSDTTRAQDQFAGAELRMREASLNVQRLIFRAVVHGLRIPIQVANPQSGRTDAWTLRPHAFGHNGWRWHVRAWCEEAREYRDFSLSWISHVEWPTEIAPLPYRDDDWETWEELAVRPAGLLNAAQRQTVEMDFGMTGGRLLVKVRKAMREHTLARLQLPPSNGRGKVQLLELDA